MCQVCIQWNLAIPAMLGTNTNISNMMVGLQSIQVCLSFWLQSDAAWREARSHCIYKTFMLHCAWSLRSTIGYAEEIVVCVYMYPITIKSWM